MNKIIFENIKETLYHEVLSNGLNVFLIPKKGFTRTYGLFSTKFGSIDTSFIPYGKDEMIKVQDGIAHFLEHKMFDMKDGDASEAFARLGASTNAFTSFSRTAYLFNTTGNVNECVELLLDFVQELNVTDESIEKEKGIINQEIGMYDDDPDWQVYFGSVRNLFVNHPVNVDIAGDVDSVSKIYKNELELCYNTFYHPSNMMLVVVGNVDPESIMDVIVSNQSKKDFVARPTIFRKKIDEPDTIAHKETVLKMDVSMNQLIASIKVTDIPTEPKLRLKREFSANILLDLLFSRSSSLIEEWEREGIINDTFSGSFTQERDYSFIQFGGETTQPSVLKDKVIDLIKNLNVYTIDEEEFNRIKKRNIGHLITLLNSTESIANMFTRYYHEGILFFDLYECVNEITLDDLKDALKLFDEDRMSICLLESK